MAKWTIKKPAAVAEMAHALKISQVMAQVMVNRGIRTKEAAEKYLNPELSFLDEQPGTEMKDMNKAVDILIDSIIRRKKITVYGDYDADGVTSTTILYKALKTCGGDVNYFIPHREEDGYGLNSKAVVRLKERGTEVILCCDNGIAALEEIREAKAQGLTVLILDHHEPGFVEDEGGRTDVLPVADAIVDPKQRLCGYPFKSLCAGGLAYKLAKNLYCAADVPWNGREYLVLAMIATVCDIVDLQDENRIIVKNGLRILNEDKKTNLGLSALLEKRELASKTIDGFHIGFVVGPCINATGRLESAALAVELLTTEDEGRAADLAEHLAELNEERKEMTSRAVERAMENYSGEDKVVVLYDSEVHESIAGIVAGRIKDRLYRPVIMLTDSGSLVKGSARSVEGYNIFEELYKCRTLFERFGGHEMAAGLSLKRENVEILRQMLNEACPLADFQETIHIDARLELEDVTYSLAKELEAMSPFGKANREPLFGVKEISPEELRIIEDKNTMILSFTVGSTYRRIKAICFGKVEVFKERLSEIYDDYAVEKLMKGVLRSAGLTMDLVYTPEINVYNGTESVQIRIKDFRIYKRD